MNVFSARICFVMPHGGIWSRWSDLGTSRSTFWPGDLFGPNLGSRKHILILLISRGVSGIPRDPNELYGP